MENIFVYLVHLPANIKEVVVPCADGCYTVYLESNLDSFSMREAFEHAVSHIRNMDFERNDVQSIESAAHGMS